MAFVVRKPGTNTTTNKSGKIVVLYGPPLVGKTSTLANDPSIKICLIDLDKNSTVIEGSDHITIIGVDSFEEYLAVKEGVDRGVFKYPGGELKMDFDLYVIDSFTRMEELIKRWVVDTFAPNRKREIGNKFGAQSDWQDLQDREIQEIRDWQAMTKRGDRPINALWIGHDMQVTNEFGQAIATQLMLQGKYAAPRIGSAVDAMFYMFKKTNPKNPEQVARGIYTLNDGIINAEARVHPRNRPKIPKIIWNPKWSEVFAMLNGEFKDDEKSS